MFGFKTWRAMKRRLEGFVGMWGKHEIAIATIQDQNARFVEALVAAKQDHDDLEDRAEELEYQSGDIRYLKEANWLLRKSLELLLTVLSSDVDYKLVPPRVGLRNHTDDLARDGYTIAHSTEDSEYGEIQLWTKPKEVK